MESRSSACASVNVTNCARATVGTSTNAIAARTIHVRITPQFDLSCSRRLKPPLYETETDDYCAVGLGQEEEWWWAGIERIDQRRIVAVRDDDERSRGAFDDWHRCEDDAGERRRLEGRSLDRDKHLQIDRTVAIGFFDRDTALLDPGWRMRREVRMHRRGVVIVVIGVDVRVQERRAHGAGLNGKRQPECQPTADHAPIVYQNRIATA
jgi:hypothetical protein